jgi:hypothetical protein
MDLEIIINLIKNMPKDKWHEQNAVKDLIRSAANQANKTYTETQLDDFVGQFQELTSQSSSSSLVSLALKGGFNKEKLEDIANKLK